jgi:hypothetical protein
VTAGYSNLAGDPFSSVSGGCDNIAGSGTNPLGNCLTGSVGEAIAGGTANTATGAAPSILGGFGNLATAEFATVGGGQGNTAAGPSSTILGGHSNTLSAAEVCVAIPTVASPTLPACGIFNP